MAAYLDLATFRLRTLVPKNVIDQVETEQPGFTDQALLTQSGNIDSRLRKRYDAPFTQTPYPEKALQWLTWLVSLDVMIRRGFDPNDAQGALYVKASDLAEAQMLEAANAKDGLYDLPLKQDQPGTGIVAPAVLSYSEASPYVAFDIQADAARAEDAVGFGTGDT